MFLFVFFWFLHIVGLKLVGLFNQQQTLNLMSRLGGATHWACLASWHDIGKLESLDCCMKISILQLLKYENYKFI